MKQLSENDSYTNTLYKKYYVVAIKRMLTVTDFVDIAKTIYKGNRKARVKFRFVESKKEKFATPKKSVKPKPQQIQLTF